MEPTQDPKQEQTEGAIIVARQPRWFVVVVAVTAWLLLMLAVGTVLRYAYRADARAERAGRTVCVLAVGIGDMADAFNRTIDLLGDGDSHDVAEREMRDPINAARANALDVVDGCRTKETTP